MRVMLLSCMLCLCWGVSAQQNEQLFSEIRAQDSLLFDVAFNTCDLAVFERLVADDLEFYHDQSGVMVGKDTFLANTKNGLCNLDYQPIRRLDQMQVFPMYNQGGLYAALQTGTHSFYAEFDHQKGEQLTSQAQFAHLWVLVDGAWKLSRIVSYDHQAP
ncbi:nuclear transport factor 2 family protein [Marinoscillum furvescens]|uniref:Uncharacterized protein DUF4440 n=1 Tax=Marinoscillum furvescens DSM 4134 TaxID=1122208 RepID=A0A3D9L563_MARFU|nr:nuclear transport factor 2 family protein [Marinoscillum furvescens]RED99769.1 uncharacterized protein DUF4440 [Marinoscillum furvescens DSM 4134]